FLFSTAKDLLGNPAIVVRASSSLSSYANREQGCSRYFLLSNAKGLPGNPAKVVRASSSRSSYANREQDALATFSSPTQKTYRATQP
ncbi:hypothetical protein, partial [Puniceicoccus vermicola]|uniref:hypothetical protein n=1 Tax=Puniceicoccus vermicola TaxID=388746 RepID=UPI001C8C1D50